MPFKPSTKVCLLFSASDCRLDLFAAIQHIAAGKKHPHLLFGIPYRQTNGVLFIRTCPPFLSGADSNGNGTVCGKAAAGIIRVLRSPSSFSDSRGKEVEK